MILLQKGFQPHRVQLKYDQDRRKNMKALCFSSQIYQALGENDMNSTLFKSNWQQQEILLFFPICPSLQTPFSLPSQRNFPISFKPQVAIAEFFWKMQRKTWYSILGLDAKPLSTKLVMLSRNDEFCRLHTCIC